MVTATPEMLGEERDDDWASRLFAENASLRQQVKIAMEALGLWAEMFPVGDGNSYGPFHPIHKTRAALKLMDKEESGG